MIIRISSIIALLFISTLSFSQSILKGRVSDKATGETLPGVSISIPDLAKSAVTGKDGTFTLFDLPKGSFKVQASFLGFATEIKTVDLNGSTNVDFKLEPSILEMREVVVTASVSASDSKSNSVSIESISKNELQQAVSGNLIDAISTVAGVSQITSGPGVSKPVIRGLSHNRVSVINNGIKQEGQQWGDEHGLEFDQFKAERVEVLRGPASLLYGSDAMGGVINILDPIPAARGQIKGEFNTRYANNNGLTGSSLMLQGNQNGVVWRARGSYKNAHSYKTPLDYVDNTAFNEKNFSGMIGLNKKWGYSHLNISNYNGQMGFIEHEHEEEGHEHSHEHDGVHRSPELPYQRIKHFKASLNNNFILGKSQLRAVLGFQQNNRKEFEHAVDHADLGLRLNSYTADVKYFLPVKNGFEPIVGISGGLQENINNGEELLVPDYQTIDAGIFAYLKKNLDHLSLNAGIRFDFRKVDAQQMLNGEGEDAFSAFNSDFSNFSGSLGLAYDLGSGFIAKANIGSAFRAPNIAELSSNGEHHGVERFEIGSSDLSSEQSLQGDLSLEYTSQIFGVTLNAYRNTIYDYIYLRRTDNETIVHEGEELPVYRYTQQDANLNGGEAVVDFHPLNWLHLGSTFELVRGLNQNSNDDLPFIPADTWRNELKIEPAFTSDVFKNSWFSIALSSTFEQKRIDRAFETQTPGYNLLSAGIGTTLQLKNQPIKLHISGKNLLDAEYVNHLNRYKYQNVLNAGRNIQFGVDIPFGLK